MQEFAPRALLAPDAAMPWNRDQSFNAENVCTRGSTSTENYTEAGEGHEQDRAAATGYPATTK